MTLDAAQQTQVEDLVGTLRRWGWITEYAAKKILKTDDLKATLVDLQARNVITPGTARSFLRMFRTKPGDLGLDDPKFNDSKAAGYDDVIATHAMRLPGENA